MTRPTAQQQDKLPLHIPLSIALYDPSGAELSLNRAGEPISGLLELTQAEQTFIFDGIDQQPIAALLQDFSAPVKLDYPYSDVNQLPPEPRPQWTSVAGMPGKCWSTNISVAA